MLIANSLVKLLLQKRDLSDSLRGYRATENPLGNVFQNETYLSGDTETSGRAVSSLEFSSLELNRAFNRRHI